MRDEIVQIARDPGPLGQHSVPPLRGDLQSAQPFLGPTGWATSSTAATATATRTRALAVFGLPRQLLGDSLLGDTRLWFLAVFVGALVAATARAHAASPVAFAGPVTALLDDPPVLVWAVLASPVVALPVAVGGHDLPVVGLMCLGLVLTARCRPVPAGIVLGVAVSVALLAVLAGCAAARRCAVIVVTTVAGPVLLGPTGAPALRQMTGFPLAASRIASPATSPTPGVRLAGAGPTRIVGLALLAAAVLGLAGWLLHRPPSDLTSAAMFLALAETIATLMLPTSRLGYLVYPAVVLAWGGR